jgi:hypothetical protein
LLTHFILHFSRFLQEAAIISVNGIGQLVFKMDGWPVFSLSLPENEI